MIGKKMSSTAESGKLIMKREVKVAIKQIRDVITA